MSGISGEDLIETGFEIGNTLDLSVLELGWKSGVLVISSLSEWSIDSWEGGGFLLIGFEGNDTRDAVHESVVVVDVVSNISHVDLLGGVETPLDGWVSRSKSVTLTDEADHGLVGTVIRSGHWDVSMESEFSSEAESEVSEILLSIDGYVKLGLLGLVAVELPSWGLAMDGVDHVGISALGEWIGDELSLSGGKFTVGLESALGVSESEKISKVVVLEVHQKNELRLEISWGFSNVGALEGWVLVESELDLISGELVVQHGCINVEWVPSDAASTGGVSHLVLSEGGGVEGVLVNEFGILHAVSTAGEGIGMVIEVGFGVSGVDETETLDLNVGATVGGKELGVGIEDEWIEETEGVVVVGVALTVDGHLNLEHIGLGVLWDLAFDHS